MGKRKSTRADKLFKAVDRVLLRTKELLEALRPPPTVPRDGSFTATAACPSPDAY